MILATDIDPTPWGAWVALIGGVIVILVAFVALIAWLWRRLAMPDVREVVRSELDGRDAKHAELHAELVDRIDAADQAHSVSIARVHDRIDKVHLRIDGLGRA